ncbi:MAG TPA: TetR/AcrR family transcriptional regulator [Xanthobacteraceae bacterium]|nr:TetR/AcrR family transcriptional regulator [Xanthobacteraceae bacterium]
MARRAKPKSPRKPSPGPSSRREKIVAAFVALLAEGPFQRINVAAVAERAKLLLADVRGEFGSTFAMLAAWMRAVDETVLAEPGDPELAAASPRERLFDVLMRRLEALGEYHDAVRSLARSVRRDPLLAVGFNRLALRSEQWMLAAAGIDSAGLKGHARAQAMVVLFSRVVRVWLRDDDPGLARTMAALDRELATAERWALIANDLCRLLPRRGRRYDYEAGQDRRGRSRHAGDEPLPA